MAVVAENNVKIPTLGVPRTGNLAFSIGYLFVPDLYWIMCGSIPISASLVSWKGLPTKLQSKRLKSLVGSPLQLRKVELVLGSIPLLYQQVPSQPPVAYPCGFNRTPIKNTHS